MNEQSRSSVDHFNDRANSWHLLYEKSAFQQRLKLFVDSLSENTSSGSSVLDFGCGAGVISSELSKIGYSVTGVDAAEGMIEAARQFTEEQKTAPVKFMHIDPKGDVLPTGEFDAVVCSSVLEYIKEDQAVLENLCRSLKQGGNLFISVPNANSLLGKLEDFAKSVGFRKEKHGEAAVNYAVRRYGSKQFSDMLGKIGFSTISYSYFECPYFGAFGEKLSKSQYVGVLLFVHAQKR